jgi:hypothetical protein
LNIGKGAEEEEEDDDDDDRVEDSDPFLVDKTMTSVVMDRREPTNRARYSWRRGEVYDKD